MPFQRPLTSGELIAHRGSSSVSRSYRARTYISLNDNAVVYSARINQSVFLKPAAQTAIDGGSGALADVMVGMTVLVSRTNDKQQAYWRGRVRKAPTASLLYHNETGAAFADNDYVWILNDFDAHIKLPTYRAGKVMLDYDLDFTGLPPIIGDIQAVYAGDGTATLSLSLAPTVTAAQSGETIATYLWTVPAGITITAGSTTTKDIDIDVDPGAQYWLHLTATDTDGTALTFHIKIWNDAPTEIKMTNVNIQCDIPISVNDGASQGYSATVDAFAGLSGLLKRTLACIWTAETYNGTDGPIFNNILFVGRRRSETDDTTYSQQGQDKSASLVLEGPLAILGSIAAQSFQMDNGSGVSDVVFKTPDLTVWRMIYMVLANFSTFAEVYPITFADTSNDFRDQLFVTQGSDVLNSIADLAQSMDAVFQAAPDGRCELARRANMLSTSDRNALDTIISFTKQDIVEKMAFEEDYRPTIARVTADGGAFDGVNTVSAYVATAPPGAPDDAPGDEQLPRQILTSGQSVTDQQAELTTRAGNAIAALQPPKLLTIQFRDSYRWLNPATDQWYTFTLDGSEFVNGLVLTTATRWWLQSVTVEPDPQTGQVTITGVFMQETSGDPGAIVPYSTIDTGKYGDLGNFGALLELPPVSDIGTLYDFGLNDGGWTFLNGHYLAGSGWVGDCTGGIQYLDITKDFGAPQTVKKIIVTYDATYTGGKDDKNQIYMRANGAAEWFPVGSSWTTITGSGSVHSVSVPNLSVSQVRVVVYAGQDCLGGATIIDIEIVALGAAIWEQVFDLTATDGGFTNAGDGSHPDYDTTAWTGSGWSNAVHSIIPIRRIVGGNIFSISFDINTPMSGNLKGAYININQHLLDGGTNFSATAQTGTHWEFTFPTGWADYIEVATQSQTPSHGTPADNQIVTVTLKGYGTNPFL